LENIDDFIKKLKVLYVEDEEQSRSMFSKFLNKKFNSSIACANGLDAYLEFDKAISHNEEFDLIISDINMPKMDGIELLEKIRDKNKDIPFIFITARSESEQMIKAINLHVNSYILKPLDFTFVESNIDKICQDIYYKRSYEVQKKETESYLAFLNKETIVTKTDAQGNITFVNDAFLEISGFTKEEVIGEKHNILKHPDTSDSVYKTIWETIQKGNNWEGRIKNLSKDKETIYLNKKIMPLFDETGKNITGYISINFLVTDEENQRRINHRKLIEQITIYKKEIASIKNEKENIENRINTINDNTIYLHEKNVLLEKKIKNLLIQVEAYERNNLELSKVDLMMKQDKSKQFELINKEMIKLKTQNRNLAKEVETLLKLLKDKEIQIETMEKKRIDYEKRIENLLDLVNNLQKELKELKESKLPKEEENTL